MRRVLFWSHLILALTAGVVVLVMSVTGVLLGFERQIVAWADRNANSPISAAGQSPLSTEKLLTGLTGAPSSVTLHNDPAKPVEVVFGRDRTVFLDPYTGAALGEGSKQTRQFFAGVVSWHRWLATAGTGRPTGRAITGACNLIFLILVLTGPILWLPAKWRWQNVRAVLLFRSGLAGKARDWNWHNVAGIWCSIPLLFIVASGVVMSYEWANDLLYRMTRTEAPARESRSAGGLAPWSGLDPLVERAKQQSPQWRAISIRPVSRGVLAFTIDEGGGGQPQKRGQLLLQRSSAEVVRWEPFSSNNAGRRLRLWSRFVHTGEAGGWIGQAIATLASSAAVLLVWTGFALSWRRFGAWRERRTRTEPAQSPRCLTPPCASPGKHSFKTFVTRCEVFSARLRSR
jgi:uncharacterized iron-regulated membrane protein